MAPQTDLQMAGAGRLADNILLFCRTLRSAGIPLGPGQVVDALRAAEAVGLQRRDDLYHALRSVLVRDPGQFTLFHQGFCLYFRDPRLLERAMALLLPSIEAPHNAAPSATMLRRLLEALQDPAVKESADDRPEIDRSHSWSDLDVLRKKDFEQMTLAELAAARQLIREDITALRARETRRYRAATYGTRYDLRRSIQLMLRKNGQLITLAKKRRQKRPPPVVLICDISGSMSAYSRVFLHFSHALSIANPRVHTFVFGTRLTNISRMMRDMDIDLALAEIATEVVDWDGGTRIADSLLQFNLAWSRRVLAQNAVVILLTDGLERESASDLGSQMQRLRRSCRQLIWLNPVLRYREFQPRALGIREMLPYVDLFLPAHNLDSLGALSRILRSCQYRPAGAERAPSAGQRFETAA
ncbi:MAG TPA: VWA domain-containing protein [Woeseiaceae bacterium]